MDVTVRIPDDLARRLGTAGELERRALEALALEEFRLGHLTKPELRLLLGFGPGDALNGFLKAHDVFAFDAPDDLGPALASVPEALDDETRARARQAAANIIARRKGVTLGGLNIKDLINEGRP
jgi:predicted transcriptional regulator